MKYNLVSLNRLKIDNFAEITIDSIEDSRFHIQRKLAFREVSQNCSRQYRGRGTDSVQFTSSSHRDPQRWPKNI